jgi:hypothetical protein
VVSSPRRVAYNPTRTATDTKAYLKIEDIILSGPMALKEKDFNGVRTRRENPTLTD